PPLRPANDRDDWPLASQALTSSAHFPALILMRASLRRRPQTRKAAPSCNGYGHPPLTCARRARPLATTGLAAAHRSDCAGGHAGLRGLPRARALACKAELVADTSLPSVKAADVYSRPSRRRFGGRILRGDRATDRRDGGTPNRRTDFARQPIATRGSAREAFFGAKRKMILPSVAGDVRKRLLGASWSLPIAAHHSFDVLGGYVRSCGLAWRREC